MEIINIELSLEDTTGMRTVLRRVYSLEEGQLPENMQERLQDMADTLLDNEVKF